jgi:hypothetical protein
VVDCLMVYWFNSENCLIVFKLYLLSLILLKGVILSWPRVGLIVNGLIVYLL